MTPKKAYDIVDQLVRGLDPATGRPIRANGVIQQPVVIQALTLAKAALKGGIVAAMNQEHGQQSEKPPVWAQPELQTASQALRSRSSWGLKEPTPEYAQKKGKPWDGHDDKTLQSMYRAGSTIRAIATLLGRETGGVISRLVLHGLIDSRDDGLALLRRQDSEEAKQKAKVQLARLTDR